MINQIAAHHQNEYGARPTAIGSSPGKFDLLGEHGDCSQGHVLSMAIDKRFYVAASPRNDNALKFYSTNSQERKKANLAGLKFKREDRWANYSKGVVDALVHMGFPLKGMNFTLMSEIPMGTGLASSSALALATVEAVRAVFSLELSDRQIVEAAHSAENRFMKLRETIRSPMVLFNSKKDHLTLIDAQGRVIEYLPLPPDPAILLITDSRVNETMSARERARIEASCEECLTAIGASNTNRLFRDLSVDDLSNSIEGLSERSRRICLHLVMENGLVQEFRETLNRQSLEALGRILFRSQESLRDQLEISCPELDWLTKRAVETEGVYGSRMIGGGYGGCTVTLLDRNLKSNYERRMEEYDRIFGFKAEVFPVEPVDGSRAHTLEQQP